MGERNIAVEALLDKMTKNQRHMGHLKSEIEYQSLELQAKNNLILDIEKEQEALKEAINRLS